MPTSRLNFNDDAAQLSDVSVLIHDCPELIRNNCIFAKIVIRVSKQTIYSSKVDCRCLFSMEDHILDWHCVETLFRL